MLSPIGSSSSTVSGGGVLVNVGLHYNISFLVRVTLLQVYLGVSSKGKVGARDLFVAAFRSKVLEHFNKIVREVVDVIAGDRCFFWRISGLVSVFDGFELG